MSRPSHYSWAGSILITLGGLIAYLDATDAKGVGGATWLAIAIGAAGTALIAVAVVAVGVRLGILEASAAWSARPANRSSLEDQVSRELVLVTVRARSSVVLTM